MHGHDDVDMVDEGGEVGGLGGLESGGGDMGWIVVGVKHSVVGGAGSFGCGTGDPIGRDLETSAVEGHEPEGRAQLEFLDDTTLREQ